MTGVALIVETVGGDAVVGVVKDVESRGVWVSFGFGLKVSFLIL